MVFVLEYLDCQIEQPAKLLIQPLHNQLTDIVVVYVLDYTIFKGMAKWTMAYIVKQNCKTHCLILLICYIYALCFKCVYSLLH